MFSSEELDRGHLDPRLLPHLLETRTALAMTTHRVVPPRPERDHKNRAKEGKGRQLREHTLLIYKGRAWRERQDTNTQVAGTCVFSQARAGNGVQKSNVLGGMIGPPYRHYRSTYNAP